MKDKSSELLTFWNTWIQVGTPKFGKKWRQMWMNLSLLHEEHLESGEGNGWLGEGEADFI
jgi:hypothetical protein